MTAAAPLDSEADPAEVAIRRALGWLHETPRAQRRAAIVELRLRFNLDRAQTSEAMRRYRLTAEPVPDDLAMAVQWLDATPHYQRGSATLPALRRRFTLSTRQAIEAIRLHAERQAGS